MWSATLRDTAPIYLCLVTLHYTRRECSCNKGVYIALDQTRVCSSQAQCSKGVYITRMLKRACRSQRDPLWVMVQLMLTSQSGFNIEAGQYKFWVWVKYCSVCYWLVMIQQVCNAITMIVSDKVLEWCKPSFVTPLQCAQCTVECIQTHKLNFEHSSYKLSKSWWSDIPTPYTLLLRAMH